MSYTPKEAAEAVGMSRQGILKAIRTGRISATKGGDGTWRIEPVELHRVYPPTSGLHATVAPSVVTSTQAVDTRLQAENEGLKAVVAQLESERDHLRRQLETEGMERRQLLAMLTDQRTDRRDQRPWWRRLLGPTA